MVKVKVDIYLKIKLNKIIVSDLYLSMSNQLFLYECYPILMQVNQS